jgi:hypothetical protein
MMLLRRTQVKKMADGVHALKWTVYVFLNNLQVGVFVGIDSYVYVYEYPRVRLIVS